MDQITEREALKFYSDNPDYRVKLMVAVTKFDFDPDHDEKSAEEILKLAVDWLLRKDYS